MHHALETLASGSPVDRETLVSLLDSQTPDLQAYAAEKARAVSDAHFSRKVYIRGLIEFTNYCRNDCFYCGIRKSNESVERYRLGTGQILSCCREGYCLGFRTFVLQGGEDEYFDDDFLVGLIESIHAAHPDCAITLSIGERSRESYERFFRAGADRYLLRHESANPQHYAKLHPRSLTIEQRKQCLYVLKDIGFQTGAGFMVGSPFQTTGDIADDLLFLRELNPQMVGIGPFIPHKDTPFRHHPAGSVEQTLFLLSLVRLMLPRVLLPATTALGTLDPIGREKGILAGANVVMPNLSPPEVRDKYLLYNDKLATGMEAAEHVRDLRNRLDAIGYHIVEERGDYNPTA